MKTHLLQVATEFNGILALILSPLPARGLTRAMPELDKRLIGAGTYGHVERVRSLVYQSAHVDAKME